MKKILYGIFVFLFALVLIGCGKSDEDKLQEYLEKNFCTNRSRW